MNEITNAIISVKSAILATMGQKYGMLDWITALGTIVAALVGLFGIIQICRELINQKKSFIEGQNQKERENITKKLNSFFGPLKELRAESRNLYQYFALQEKKLSLTMENKRFRTLRHLARGKNFSSQDQSILNEIINLGNKQLELIEKEGNIVENSNLAELLGQLGTHVRLLSLASNKKLLGMDKILEPIVYPYEVDGAIESEIRRLQDRYHDLMNQTPIKRKQAKISNKEQRKTISYYNRDSQSYFKETAYIDLEDIYQKFREHIPYGGMILDAGCGVGRDTRFFIKKGYRVISFDASLEMVKLCRQYPFAYCLHKSFNEIEFREEFDGIWACASLIHLPRYDFIKTIHKLAGVLKPNGVIYISIKEGSLSKIKRQEKTTYFHKDEVIRNVMEKDLLFEERLSWRNKGKSPSEFSDWLNYIYQKKKC